MAAQALRIAMKRKRWLRNQKAKPEQEH
jgi:hypothetical protein